MMRRLLQNLVLVIAAAMLIASPVQAVSQDDLINQGIDAYELNPCGTAPVPTTGGAVEGSAAQITKVKTIIGVAKALNLTPKAALIAFMTVYQESWFHDYANDGHQQGGQTLKDLSSSNPNAEGFPSGGGDHDSVGIFQQRPSSGWSTFGSSITKDTVWQIMGDTKSDQAVAYSAQAFFGTPKGYTLPASLANPGALKKGLVNKVPNYNDPGVQPGVAAQTVQVSAFPDAYNKHEQRAQALVDQYWNDTDAIAALPVPLNGSGDAPTGSGNDPCITVSGHGEIVDKMLSKVVEYAWPNYCKQGSSRCTGYATAVTKKPEYEQAVRRGGYNGDTCFGGGVDCGAFVTHVMRDSGADPKYNSGGGPTGAQRDYLIAHSQPGATGAKYHQVLPSEPLMPGDIAVNDGHTFMYVGKIPGFNGESASASQCGRAPMASGGDARSDYSWFRILSTN